VLVAAAVSCRLNLDWPDQAGLGRSRQYLELTAAVDRLSFRIKHFINKQSVDTKIDK